MLVQRGTLRVGDAIVAGDAAGKVRALYDYRGERVKEARPGDPVEILGFDRPPPAGELARVVEHERQAKDLAEKRSERLRREQLAQRSKAAGVSLETLFERMQAGAVQELNVVLKGDVQGSVEALMGELGKIQHPEVRVNVIHTGVGGITENDVNLASASNALVVGFNVRPSVEARQLAEREGVDIRTYRVIYKLTEDIEQALVGMLSPVTTEEILGEAEVRALFKVSRLGTIAGCMVTNGVVRRGAQVRIIRDGTVIHETTIDQLKRFKDDAREVSEGFECGILLAGFNDVKEGDILEAYETREVERTDLATTTVAASRDRVAGFRPRDGGSSSPRRTSPPSLRRARGSPAWTGARRPVRTNSDVARPSRPNREAAGSRGGVPRHAAPGCRPSRRRRGTGAARWSPRRRSGEAPASASVSRTTRRKAPTAPGSSFVPTLTTTTRGSAAPKDRSAPGTSAAWRLTSVEE